VSDFKDKSSQLLYCTKPCIAGLYKKLYSILQITTEQTNMEQGEAAFRAFLAVIGWLVVLAASLWTGVVIFIADYMGLAHAFELLGMEQYPLSHDNVVGPYLGIIFGKATASGMLAYGIASLVFLTMFFAAREMRHYVVCRGERARAELEGDAQWIASCEENMGESSAALAFIIPALLILIALLVFLFKFRAVASTFNLVPGDAAGKIESLTNYSSYGLASTDHLLLTSIAYIAILFLCAMITELALARLSLASRRLAATLDRLRGTQSNVSTIDVSESLSDEHVLTHTIEPQVQEPDSTPQQLAEPTHAPVIGGQGDNISIEEALSSNEYVVHNGRVYERAYHNNLYGRTVENV
jgi:hypothetical protein